MASVRLDGRRIGGWPAFHDECARAFGFPAIYGRNMDAWIDCMRGLRDGDGMSRFTLAADELLTIELVDSGSVPPAILETLEECVAEVNADFAEHGQAAALALVLR